MRPVPSARTAVALLRDAGVVTNQSGIARGMIQLHPAA